MPILDGAGRSAGAVSELSDDDDGEDNDDDDDDDDAGDDMSASLSSLIRRIRFCHGIRAQDADATDKGTAASLDSGTDESSLPSNKRSCCRCERDYVCAIETMNEQLTRSRL